MLDYLQLLNFSRSVTVGECMGDPPENWYRAAGGAANHTLLVGFVCNQMVWDHLLTISSYTIVVAILSSTVHCSSSAHKS